MGCQGKDGETTQIDETDQVSVESMTLLERAEVKLDSRKEANLELYTSAEKTPDGRMGWDSGDQWSVFIRYDNKVFELFNEYVQYGEVQFWVSDQNPENIVNPECDDLEHHIYVMVTDVVGFTMYDCVWDTDAECFQKTVILKTDNQWNIYHSNKYSIYDESRVQNVD